MSKKENAWRHRIVTAPQLTDFQRFVDLSALSAGVNAFQLTDLGSMIGRTAQFYSHLVTSFWLRAPAHQEPAIRTCRLTSLLVAPPASSSCGNRSCANAVRGVLSSAAPDTDRRLQSGRPFLRSPVAARSQDFPNVPNAAIRSHARNRIARDGRHGRYRRLRNAPTRSHPAFS